MKASCLYLASLFNGRTKKVLILYTCILLIKISARYVLNSWWKFIDRILLLSHKLPDVNCENETFFFSETSMKTEEI